MAALQSMTLQERMVTIINAEHSLSYGINDLTFQEACNKWLIETGTVNSVDYSGISINEYSPNEALAIIRHKLDLRSENLTELIHELGPYYPIHKYTAQEALNKRNAVLVPYSLSFDGIDDYVDTGFQPNFIHTNATMSYWCKLDDLLGDQILGCHNSKRFYLGFSTSNIIFGTANSYKNSTDVSAYISTGTWMHLCLVMEDGTATVYINGVARDTNTYVQSASTNPDTNFFIGARSAAIGASAFMASDIDEVSIFNKALTQAEVNSLYAANPQNAGDAVGITNLVGYWKMDHGSGPVARDVSVAEELGSEFVTNGDSDSILPTMNGVSLTLYDILTPAHSDEQHNTSSYNGEPAGSKSIKVIADSSSSYPLIRFLDGTDCGLVTGNTYYFSCYVYLPSGQALDWIYLNVYTNAGTNEKLAETFVTDQWVHLDGYYISDDAQRAFEIRCQKSAGGLVSNNYYYVDQLSVKEVTNGNHGTITGATWTVH